MRTTLTIEPDVAQRIKRRMSQKKLPLKRVINDALRAGLTTAGQNQSAEFSVEPHACKFKAGVDPDRLNQLSDELEAEASRPGLTR